MTRKVRPLATDRVRVTMEDMAQAIVEAQRCMQCPKPTCRTGCPIGNEIPQFIKALAQGNIGEAIRLIQDRSCLPSICGRVCPHENQCEGHCILNRRGQPVKIGQIESLIGDVANAMMLTQPKRLPKKKQKVAVIGSGPAGLSAANDLRMAGYGVDVFDRSTEPGGVLLHGIPDFRIHKSVVRFEVERLVAMGVQFHCGQGLGKHFQPEDLWKDGYDAIFLGIGTSQPRDLELRNGHLPGILQAMDLLETVQAAHDGHARTEVLPVVEGDRVIVIGAGNVAIDAARTAVRMGAKSVTVVYRRTEQFMACLPSEYEEAKEEQIKFQFLAAPIGVEGRERVQGFVYEVQEMNELGEISATGQEVCIPADKVIIAVGHVPDSMLRSVLPKIEYDTSGYIRTHTDDEGYYGMTAVPGVFAAGDIVHRPATVVLAMREARKTAKGMIAYLAAKETAAREAKAATVFAESR